MSMRRATVAIGLSGILLAMGCGVTQSKYDTTATKLKRAERDLSLAQDDHNKTKQQLTMAEMRLKGMRAHLQSVQKQSAAAKDRLATLDAQLRSCKSPPPPPVRRATAPPPPRPGAASAAGGLDLAAVQATIQKLMPKIRKCYEKRVLKKGKKLAGTLLVKFRINNRGKTRRVKVRRGTLKHRRLQKCVRRVFRKARFRRSKKTTKVSYPLSFAP